MNHVMIDLETLGINNNAPVISIGAVIFDPATGQLGETFHEKVDFESACARSQLDASTVKWWMRQTDEARLKVIDGTADLYDVLMNFQSWLPAAPIVWGNGATFDITILANAYRSRGKNEPWGFRDVRDVRTIMAVALPYDPRLEIPFTGVEHDAKDDAVYQAQYVSAAWQRLQGK